MDKFKLGNEKIEFSDDFFFLNIHRINLLKLGRISRESLKEGIDRELQERGDKVDVNRLVANFPAAMDDYLSPCIKYVVDVLVDLGIYTCDETVFMQKYKMKYFAFENFEGYKRLKEEFDSVIQYYGEIKQYRQLQRESRSYWQGGGFGVGGAIKGALTAGAMNIATDAFRGIGDTITNATDKSNYNIDKMNIIKSQSLWDDIYNDLEACIFGVYLGLEDEYEDFKNIQCFWSYDESIDKANAIFRNVQSRLGNIDLVCKLMKEAIKLNPYCEEYYEFLYLRDGIKKEEVKKIAKFLGYEQMISKIDLELFVEERQEIQHKFMSDTGKLTKKVEEATEVIEAIIENKVNLDFGYEYVMDLQSLVDIYANEDFAICNKYQNFTVVEEIYIVEQTYLEFEQKFLICGYQYGEKEHSFFVEKTLQLIEKYSKFKKVDLERSKDFYQYLTTKMDIKEFTELSLIREINHIIEGKAITHADKLAKLHSVAMTRRILTVDYNIDTNWEKREIALVLLLQMAYEEFCNQYYKIVEAQIKTPTEEIFDVRSEVKQLFLKYHIIDSLDSGIIDKDFVGIGVDNKVDYLNQNLKDLSELCMFLGKIEKEDISKSRKEIRNIIYKEVCSLSSDSQFMVNINNDDNFGHDSKLYMKLNFSKHQKIYLLYEYKSLLMLGVAVCEDGIYSRDVNNSFITWVDFYKTMKSTGFTTLSYWRGDHKITFETGDECQLIPVLNQIAEKIFNYNERNNKVNLDIFHENIKIESLLQRRINEYLANEHHEFIVNSGSKISSFERYEKMLECQEEVLYYERNPQIRLVYSGYAKEYSDFSGFFLTDKYIYKKHILSLNDGLKVMEIDNILNIESERNKLVFLSIDGQQLSVSLGTEKADRYTKIFSDILMLSERKRYRKIKRESKLQQENAEVINNMVSKYNIKENEQQKKMDQELASQKKNGKIESTDVELKSNIENTKKKIPDEKLKKKENLAIILSAISVVALFTPFAFILIFTLIPGFIQCILSLKQKSKNKKIVVALVLNSIILFLLLVGILLVI